MKLAIQKSSILLLVFMLLISTNTLNRNVRVLNNSTLSIRTAVTFKPVLQHKATFPEVLAKTMAEISNTVEQ